MQQKIKNRLLIAGFITMLFIAYKLGIAKTIAIKKEFTQLKTDVEAANSIAGSLQKLQQKEQQADALLKKNNLQNISVQNNLLSILTNASQSKEFTISNFEQPHLYTQDGFTKTSYQFSLKGNFKGILETIYALEQNYSLGNIAHLHFEKKLNYRTRKFYLETDVIVENFFSE